MLISFQMTHHNRPIQSMSQPELSAEKYTSVVQDFEPITEPENEIDEWNQGPKKATVFNQPKAFF